MPRERVGQGVSQGLALLKSHALPPTWPFAVRKTLDSVRPRNVASPRLCEGR